MRDFEGKEIFSCRFWVRLANFFLSSILFDRLQSFDEIQPNSIDFDYRMFDYIRRDTKVVKTKSFFILLHHPHVHENNLPDQCHQSRLVPRDLSFLLNFYNQYCCSGLHFVLNYISTRRSLYFLDHTHMLRQALFLPRIPECTYALSFRTRAGRVG